MGNKDIFDDIAKQYDTSQRIEIANIAVDKIREYIINSNEKRAIDFGCGTGLIGFALANEFDSITFLDISPNMIEYVKEKIKIDDIKNASTICFDTENYEMDITHVDYILMVQVLLHIEDTDSILKKLYSLLNHGGHLIIVDFDKNDLVESELVHNGFEQKELLSKLRRIGFKDIKSNTFYHGENIFMNKKASLFIIDAKK